MGPGEDMESQRVKCPVSVTQPSSGRAIQERPTPAPVCADTTPLHRSDSVLEAG